MDKLIEAMNEVGGLNDTHGVNMQGGKKYTQVVHRVQAFRKHLGLEYGLDTQISTFGGGFLCKAYVMKEDLVIGSGHAYTADLNKNKSLEKLESTAIGRAMASIGLSGGEYATDLEVDSWEDRYEDLMAAVKQTLGKASALTEKQEGYIKDIRFLIGGAQDAVEINSIWDEWGQIIGDLPESDQIALGEYRDSEVVKRNGGVVNQTNTYTFKNVRSALGYKATIERKINGAKDAPQLEAAIKRWDGKLKALDKALSAKQYQNELGSPYQQIISIYNDQMIKLLPKQEKAK